MSVLEYLALFTRSHILSNHNLDTQLECSSIIIFLNRSNEAMQAGGPEQWYRSLVHTCIRKRRLSCTPSISKYKSVLEFLKRLIFRNGGSISLHRNLSQKCQAFINKGCRSYFLNYHHKRMNCHYFLHHFLKDSWRVGFQFLNTTSQMFALK